MICSKHWFAQLLDLYLFDEYWKDWDAIVRLAKIKDQLSWEKSTRYVIEGCHLSIVAQQLNRVVAKDAVIDDRGKQIHCKAGDIIFLNLVYRSFSNLLIQGAANMSPEIFPRKSRLIAQFPSTSILDGACICASGLLSLILDWQWYWVVLLSCQTCTVCLGLKGSWSMWLWNFLESIWCRNGLIILIGQWVHTSYTILTNTIGITIWWEVIHSRSTKIIYVYSQFLDLSNLWSLFNKNAEVVHFLIISTTWLCTTHKAAGT